MVRALFRQLVLMVASLTTSAALMAVVVTLDGGTQTLDLLGTGGQAPAPALRVAQAPTVSVGTASPRASSCSAVAAALRSC